VLQNAIMAIGPMLLVWIVIYLKRGFTKEAIGYTNSTAANGR
jgi:hypothetical protein